MRKVTWASRMGEASQQEARPRSDQTGASRPPCFCSEVPLGIHAAEASREHKVSSGPARLPDLVTSQAAPLAGSLPLGSCRHQPQLLLRLSPQSPPSRNTSPPHAPPAVSLLPTAFFLTLLQTPKGSSGAGRRGWAGRDTPVGAGKGHGTGERGQQGAHGWWPQAQAAPPVASLTGAGATGPPGLSPAVLCVALGRSLSQPGPLFPHL